MKLACPHCGATRELEPTALKFTSLSKRCSVCSTAMVRVKTLKRKTDVQRRSQDQEKRASKTYNMRQQPATGALPNYKADLRERNKRRLEAKETTKRSFTIKLDQLLKLEYEACAAEMPIFLLEFQCVYPYKRYEILPAGTLSNLIAENDELKRRLINADHDDQ